MIGIDEATRLWRLGDVGPLADTHGSLVYRARLPDGQSVIAKLLKPRGMGEISGMDYLAWRDGSGAARLIAREDNACLLEDAGARSLEDVRATDGEATATDVFAAVVARLHMPSPQPVPAGLVPLERHFAALVDDQVSMPAEHLSNVAWAADVARTLLANQIDVMPLHGDLHHENILVDAHGTWRAIDPHGLIGDPVYDLANFFGNPIGRPDITCDKDRIGLLSASLSTALGYDGQKILRYAAAHAALSACWSIGEPVSEDDLRDAGHRLAFLGIIRTMLA